MKAFKTTCILETKRALNKKVLGLFLFILFLSLYFVQTGISKYKRIIISKYSFQEFERLKVKQYSNYNQYGAFGFQILFMPSPLSIYFVNSSPVTELTARVDPGELLNIYNFFNGKLSFVEKSGGLKDFSGVLLLLGSLLILYFGYEAFIHKDYLRFMSGFIDYKRFFLAIVLARMLIFILFFMLMAGFSLVLLGFNGIKLTRNELLHTLVFLGVLSLMMIFFFILGTIACSFKSNFTGLIMIIISWFTLVYLVPGTVNTIISQKADSIIPGYQLELQGLKEFKQIAALEERLAIEMDKNISGFQTLSAFFPSTFYLVVGNEISSKGYDNFICFYEYTRTLKMEFVKFCREHKFNSAEVAAFIKDNENLFIAESRVPQNMQLGTSIMLIYIATLLVLSYRRFKKSLKL